MRFCIIKHEQICKGCDCSLAPGEKAVIIRVHGGIPLPFHTECFLEWNKNMFHYRLQQWEQSQTKETKIKHGRGRPRKYINPALSRRLKASIYYYAKKDNVEKVSELVGKLRELRA